MRTLTIIGEAGYRVGSINSFSNALDLIVSGRTRYWELWLAFVRDMYLRLVITPLKVDTGDERADIFTKAMPKGNGDYYRFRDDLMNVSSRVP